MDIKVYWEKKELGKVDEFEFKASVYNNLFGAGVMTAEMVKEAEGLAEEVFKNDQNYGLLPAELNSYITSLVKVCSQIDLKISPTTHLSSSRNILVKTESTLHPYKNLQNFWVSLSPSLKTPVLLTLQDFQKEIKNFPAESQILDFSFNPPSACPSSPPASPSISLSLSSSYIFPSHPPGTTISLPIQPTIPYSKLLICKPNKQFLKYYYKPSTTVQILLNHLKQATGSCNLQLYQKLSPSRQRFITEPSSLISTFIQYPNQNIFFCTLN